MNFAFDCPVEALGTEFAFSTFTTCPASVPKYKVEELVVCGDTVSADIFEVKKVDFYPMADRKFCCRVQLV